MKRRNASMEKLKFCHGEDSSKILGGKDHRMRNRVLNLMCKKWAIQDSNP